MKRRRMMTSHETKSSSSSSRRKHRRKETKYIPPDIIEQILLRLPVKSVIRFRLVCKLWCAISSDASFVAKHLSFANKNSSLDLVDSSILENKISIYEDGFYKCDIWTPVPLNFPKTRIIGSCINIGLLCLYEDEKLIIFNPGTRQSISLPDPYFRRKLDWPSLYFRKCKFNFGFNPNSNEYKIVYIYEEEIGEIGDFNQTPWCRLEVFTLGKDTRWRQIEGGAPVKFQSEVINIGAAMYWKVYDHYYTAISILFFDLLEEKLVRIKAPDEEDHRSTVLMDLNGRLCWVSVSKSGQDKMIMNLWTLDEKSLNNKSWTHLHAIDLLNLTCDISCSDLWLWYVPRNKILVGVRDRRKDFYTRKYYIFYLTIKNDSVEYVLSVPDDGKILQNTTGPYVESLIPLP